MLEALSADTAPVIHRVLVLTAIACCALVAMSFAMFARDQVAGASKHQQNEIVAGAATNAVPIPVHKATAQPRRFIDSAASTLTSPFRGVVQSDSEWVLHGVPTIVALLVYGVGIGYVARYSRGLS
jgi:hypothetical protein